eukprot:COSAG02_NODE_6719_length_3402_cov_9.452619_4_plen_80_part_00
MTTSAELLTHVTPREFVVCQVCRVCRPRATSSIGAETWCNVTFRRFGFGEVGTPPLCQVCRLCARVCRGAGVENLLHCV